MSKFIYNIQRQEHTEDYIEKNKLFNVFVFGLPRSGTSMMTHICELLGVKMIHTSEQDREKLDTQYESMFGSDYHPNPNGFFEITKNILENYLEIIRTPYSGCKMIVPVVGIRWELIKLLPSKIIMMSRNPDEISESHDAFYSKNRPMSSEFARTALASEIVKLRTNKIDFIEVKFSDLFENKEREVLRIKEFIKSDFDITQAVLSIKEDLYRQRVA